MKKGKRHGFFNQVDIFTYKHILSLSLPFSLPLSLYIYFSLRLKKSSIFSQSRSLIHLSLPLPPLTYFPLYMRLSLIYALSFFRRPFLSTDPWWMDRVMSVCIGCVRYCTQCSDSSLDFTGGDLIGYEITHVHAG